MLSRNQTNLLKITVCCPDPVERNERQKCSTCDGHDQD